MYNPRQQQGMGNFVDDLQVVWAQNISKIGDVVVQAHELMRETHKRVREDPANFIEMTGAIRAEKIPQDTLMLLSTIAETLVFLKEKDIQYIPLMIKYRSNVNVLFIKYFRTVLEGILALFLGDDKAKKTAEQADKQRPAEFDKSKLK